jgi:uncharacterized OB-fold protein
LYKEQLQQIKGVATCANCGETVAYSATFCSSCGAARPATAAPNPSGNACPKCSKILMQDQLFCTGCGTKTEQTVASPQKDTDSNEEVDEVKETNQSQSE